jgi:hypothetical protein
MLDKTTARKNISLALILALLAVVLFAGTILIGEIVVNV